MMNRRPAFVLVVFLPLAGCSGASEALPALHPLAGTVVRDGQPVAGGTLRFYPQPERPALVVNATVGPDGKFSAHTEGIRDPKKTQHAGAPEGTYKVTYYPPEGQAGATPTEAANTVTVKSGTNEVTIDLGAKK